MREIPGWTMAEAERLRQNGLLTDAGLRLFKVCRRYQILRQEGKKRGESVLLLAEEFNLSDSRIEEMIDPPRKEQGILPVNKQVE